MVVSTILILGAGPAGLAAALALSKEALRSPTDQPPIRIRVFELRPDIQTIGGAVNLTPLALRYLDYLGAGARLRPRGYVPVAIDLLSHRTGGLLGSLWSGLDSLRVSRKAIVESLLETVRTEHQETIDMRYGMKVQRIRDALEGSDETGKIVLEFENGEEVEGDVLLGCDGLHSTVRRLYVEPTRKEAFTKRVIVMGFSDVEEGNAKICRPNGESILRSSSLIQGQRGSLLVTYYEPTRCRVFLASLMAMAEPDGELKEGWRLLGSDGESLRKDIFQRYMGGAIRGLEELVSKCEEWNLYPVYTLPPGGLWSRNRVLLLGDAAHAMAPQGESSAYALEDGVLLAHVFSRRGTRTVGEMFTDYETMRRPTINKHYKRTAWAFEQNNADCSWLWALFMEYLTMLYLLVYSWSQSGHLAGDVRQLDLPH